MKEPLVSVVITSFRKAKFIEDAIQSIVDQTYQNWELIIVDDGSPDNSLSLSLGFKRSLGDKLKVLTKKNEGAAAARNSGFRFAKGDLFLTLDGDDLINNVYLEKAIDTLRKNPEADLVYPNTKAFGLVEKDAPAGPFKLPDLLIKTDLVPVTCLFTRELFYRVGGYWSSLPAFEDWEFWIECLKLKAIGVHSPESLLLYRHHDAYSLNVEGRKIQNYLNARACLIHRNLYQQEYVDRCRTYLGFDDIDMDSLDKLGRFSNVLMLFSENSQQTNAHLRQFLLDFSSHDPMNLFIVLDNKKSVSEVKKIIESVKKEKDDLPKIVIVVAPLKEGAKVRELLHYCGILLLNGHDLEQALTKEKLRTVKSVDDLHSFLAKEIVFS